jgi:uncharacterized protein YndB with AHSA1/START domain
MDAAKSAGRMLQKRLSIRAPAATVWKAMTDAAELARWFPTAAETDPRPGGTYRFRFEYVEHPERDHSREGSFVDLAPPKRLSYTWHAPLADAPGAEGPPETTVEISLIEKAGQTDVVLTHSGFGYGADWDRSFERHSENWAFFVLNLRSYLEHGTDARGEVLGMRTAPGAGGEARG